LETINQQLKNNFYNNSDIKKLLKDEFKNLENGKTTPFTAATRLLNKNYE
jgi:LAO/AO transport system kinase